MTAGEAVAYLRLDEGCGSVPAARRPLDTLVAEGHIHPLPWATKSRLYHRANLDAFVAASVPETGAISTAADTADATTIAE